MFGSNDEHLEIMGITLQMPTLTFEAESISYLVCQHFGIETSPNSFGYLANYGDENLTELKVSLDTIRKSANALIVGIEEQFKQISRERETPAPQQNDVTSTEPITAEESAQIKEYMDDLVSEKAVNKSNLLLPDPSISADERDAYGYKFADMLPLTKDRALELFDSDIEVFLLHEDTSESMVFERYEIENFDGIFGIERGDWERSAEFKAKSEVATEHTEILLEEPHDNNIITSSAVNSNYKNKVALVGDDDNIYLGKSDKNSYNFESIDGDVGALLFGLAARYYVDNKSDIHYSTEGSFLEDYDEDNVAVAFKNALEKAQPTDLLASEISVRLGSTWVDKKYIEQFMCEFLQTPHYLKNTIRVNFSAYISEWNIEGKTRLSSADVLSTFTYGTKRLNAYKILEDTLNLKDVRVYDIKEEDGK